MLKKFGLLVAITGAISLATPTSFPPIEAAPLHPSLSLTEASTDSNAIDLVWRSKRRSRLASAGIGVFIIPGVYWGPAWWDKTYARVCWKLIRPCRNCAENWIYVC